MKKEKEIVLYVEDADLVQRKKADMPGKDRKEVSLLYGFTQKIIQRDLAIYTEKWYHRFQR
jgi:hypothetical protein